MRATSTGSIGRASDGFMGSILFYFISVSMLIMLSLAHRCSQGECDRVHDGYYSRTSTRKPYRMLQI